MCPVIDGQAVNAAVSNAAWLDAQTDDTAVGKLTLANTDVASGASVTNMQAEHNSIASFVGKALNTAYNALPSWAASYVGSASDTIKARVDALTARFSGSIGHSHDGTDGNGPAINSVSLVTTQSTNSSTGNIDALSTATSLSVRLTGASAVTLRGVANGLAAKRVTVMNDTSFDLIVKNLSGSVTSTNRIASGTGADLTIKTQGALLIEYDGTDNIWRAVGGPGGDAIVAYQEVPSGVVDGTNASFTTSLTPVNAQSVVVMIDSLPRTLTTDWTMTGTTITFQAGSIPLPGQLVYVYYLYLQSGGVAPSVGTTGQPKTEYRTITSGEAAAKSLTLIHSPMAPSEILLDEVNGVPCQYNVDFTVSGAVVSWTGFAFDGVISAGDVLRIHYYY